MKNYKLLLIIAFILGISSTYAQGSKKALTVNDAITIGLENNYGLQIIKKTEAIAKINNTWGNTSLVPSINFSLSGRENYNFNDYDNYRRQTIDPDLSLNWVIFNGFSAKINKAKFAEMEERSKGNTTILVETTIQDIILGYNNCLLQSEMVKVYKELADLSEDRYNRTMDSKDLGVSTTYESLQAKTSMLEDKSNYLQQKVTFDNAVRTLNFALGEDVNTQWEFTTSLEVETPDYTMDALSQKLLSNNSTIKNQYLYQSLLAKETALAKSAYSPTLSLNTGIGNSDYGQYYTGNTPDIETNSSDAYIGLTLSWSIYNGGARKRSVEIAKINEESLSVQTTQMEHSLNTQLWQMYSNYEVQKDILALAIEQETTAKLNLDLSADKLANGSINSFNYRDVQVMYLNAAISKYRSIYQVIMSNTDLLRITGGIVNEYEVK